MYVPSCHPAPDFSTHTIAIDRSQSGITVSDTFSASDRQAKVVTNPDGSVDLHIFVDRMSVEVFTADDTISDANQIFPTGYPDGLAAFAENGVATLDATVHQLAGIWTVKGEQSLTPTGISVDATSVVANPGATSDVRVWVTPGYTDQGWTVSSSEPGVAWVVRADTGLSIVASRPGTTTITIASAADPSITKTITVTVHANEFKTNVDGLTPTAGTWHIDGRAYHVDGAGLNAFLMSSEEYSLDGNFSYEVDVNYSDSTTNLVFGSQITDPFGGCYAIRLRSDGTLRLFDFKGDHTFTQVAADLSYGHTYHVTATVRDGTVRVSIDGTGLIAYQLTDQDKADARAYEKGYVDLGVWDTASTTFENFFMYDTAHPKSIPTPPPTPRQCHHHHHGRYGCGYRCWWGCDHPGRCVWHCRDGAAAGTTVVIIMLSPAWIPERMGILSPMDRLPHILSAGSWRCPSALMRRWASTASVDTPIPAVAGAFWPQVRDAPCQFGRNQGRNWPVTCHPIPPRAHRARKLAANEPSTVAEATREPRTWGQNAPRRP